MMTLRRKLRDPFSEIQLCLRKRDYPAALGWFDALLDKYPTSTQIRLRFADTLVLAGRENEAVKQYRVVAKELSDRGFSVRATAIHKKILSLDPTLEDVHDDVLPASSDGQGSPGRLAAATTTRLAEVLFHPDEPLKQSGEREQRQERLHEGAPAEMAPDAYPELELLYPIESFHELSLWENVRSEIGVGEESPASASHQESPPAAPPQEPPAGVASAERSMPRLPEARGT